MNVAKFSSTRGSYKDEIKNLSASDTEVLIENGTVLSGILDKNTVGRSEGGLIHVIWIECGPEATKLFINHAQQLVNNWLIQRGYTIGVGDTIADSETIRIISRKMAEARADVDTLTTKLQSMELETKPGMSLTQTFEHEVNKALNKAVGEAGTAASTSLARDNNIKVMVNGGSKGNAINIAQMIACVGMHID